jgi:hypothetical protein
MTMSVRIFLFALTGLGLASAPAAAAQFDRARAEANYVAVARGTKQLNELTPVEVQEVAAIDRELRRTSRPRLTPQQRCFAANMPADRPPTQLELGLIDLKCAGR